MEVDKEKFKQLIVKTVNIFKDLETEIIALRAVLYSLKATFNIEGDPEQLVEAGRNASSIKKMMGDRYDAPLEEFLQHVDKNAAMDEKFLEFLRSWKPSPQPD